MRTEIVTTADIVRRLNHRLHPHSIIKPTRDRYQAARGAYQLIDTRVGAVAFLSVRDLEDMSRELACIADFEVGGSGMTRTKVDIEITGQGFYIIRAKSATGKKWMRQVEGFDGKQAASDQTDMTVAIAEGAVRDGLRVEVNGSDFNKAMKVAEVEEALNAGLDGDDDEQEAV